MLMIGRSRRCETGSTISDSGTKRPPSACTVSCRTQRPTNSEIHMKKARPVPVLGTRNLPEEDRKGAHLIQTPLGSADERRKPVDVPARATDRTLVLGTGFCLHHFADGPLAGLCFRAAFIFLGLLGFAIPMLFTVCHGRTSSASGGMTWSADQCQSILHRLQSGITAADVVPIDNHGLD
jgi:hypothetical protein